MKNIKNIDYHGDSNIAILEDYDTTRWNELAQRTNTRMFVRMNGRNPVDYEEVRSWVLSLSEPNKKPAAVTASSLVQPVN